MTLPELLDLVLSTAVETAVATLMAAAAGGVLTALRRWLRRRNASGSS